MKKCIIVGNGFKPLKKDILLLRKKNYNFLICADAGADHLYKMSIIPDLIIGDLDSISQKVLSFYSNKTKILHIKRQNDTDIEKALKYAISLKYDEAILLGVIGNRLDHSFCNIGIALKFYDIIKVRLLSGKSILSVQKDNITFRTIKGEIISIYGINTETKISSKGLLYKLNNTALPFGIRESTSNVAVSDRVALTINKGKIIIIRDKDILLKNDLI